MNHGDYRFAKMTHNKVAMHGQFTPMFGIGLETGIELKFLMIDQLVIESENQNDCGNHVNCSAQAGYRALSTKPRDRS